MRSCKVYSVFCLEHNVTHGAEAEELRKGIEKILLDGEHTEEWPDKLQQLLEKVDAGDSLAYTEAKSLVADSFVRRHAQLPEANKKADEE